MKSILMATDLSARSDRALDRAVALAREHGADVTIVHVVDEDLPTSIADTQMIEATRSVEGQVERLDLGETPNVAVEVVLGRPFASILEMSEKAGGELIVLGMHRADALKDMFRGTTAERVIRAGQVPVLLVKDRVTTPYRQIMIGVDFSICSRSALEFAIKIAPTGTFHLVHAFDVPFSGFLGSRDTRVEVRQQHERRLRRMIEQEMEAFLTSQVAEAVTLERILREGTVRDVIHHQVGQLQPDLLVVGTHGRTGIAHAILGSVAEDLLRDPPCDVLAVKAW